MVSLSVCENFVVLVSKSLLKAFDLREAEIAEPHVISFADHPDANEAKEDKYFRDPNKPVGQVLAACITPSSKFFAVCTDWKELIVFSPAEKWRKLLCRSTLKRCTAICFNPSEERVFVADKFGDVYSFSLTDPEDEGVLEAGHLSMLLDMTISPDGRFLLTCDRDEKVRISCLPNAYNIHSFCLGHTEFVSCCQILPSIPSILVTGSGDCTLRFWDYKAGIELRCLDLKQFSPNREEISTVTGLACSKQGNLIAVTISGEKSVLLYQVSLSNEDSLSQTNFTTVPLSWLPWCLTFDPDDRLWVVAARAEGAVQVYKVQSDSLKVEKVDPQKEGCALAEVLKEVNSDWSFFEASKDLESIYTNLHKKNVDNMADYMERKKQRLDDETKKQRKKELKEENKKLKTS